MLSGELQMLLLLLLSAVGVGDGLRGQAGCSGQADGQPTKRGHLIRKTVGSDPLSCHTEHEIRLDGMSIKEIEIRAEVVLTDGGSSGELGVAVLEG